MPKFTDIGHLLYLHRICRRVSAQQPYEMIGLPQYVVCQKRQYDGTYFARLYACNTRCLKLLEFYGFSQGIVYKGAGLRSTAAFQKARVVLGEGISRVDQFILKLQGRFSFWPYGAMDCLFFYTAYYVVRISACSFIP